MKTIKQDIGLTLLIKFGLLTLLWALCFHHPKISVNLEKQFFPSPEKHSKIGPKITNSISTTR